MIIAVGLASAWVLLTLLLGFGSSDARADEPDDGGASGGLLSSVVDAGTAVVSDVATGAVEAVTAVVETTVNSAPLPEPVAAVVAPVTDGASNMVVTVAEAVSSTASSGIVAPVADAVNGLVSRTPIVSGVADVLGVDDALTSLGTGLDSTVADAAGSLAGTGKALQLPALPTPILPTMTSLPASEHDDGHARGGCVAVRRGRRPLQGQRDVDVGASRCRGAFCGRSRRAVRGGGRHVLPAGAHCARGRFFDWTRWLGFRCLGDARPRTSRRIPCLGASSRTG